MVGPARLLLYVAAAMRAAAYRMRAAARRLDQWIGRPQPSALAIEELQTMSYRELRDIGLSRCDVQVGGPHTLGAIAHLDVHALKDIGAPHWLVASAAERRDREHLSWLGLAHR